MYDPKIGKWISADPIGFEGEDANLYRYVGNSTTRTADPIGLWSIQRQGGAKANVISELDDQIGDLGPMLGLDSNEKNWEDWLTVTSDPVHLSNGSSVDGRALTGKMKLCADQEFKVPNTMISAWFGDAGWLGKKWVGWSRNNQDLGKLGFKVVTFDNDRYSDPDTAKSVFLGMVNSHSKNKSLHGLYAMGHGTNATINSIGFTDGRLSCGPKTLIPYTDIGEQLSYSLGALVIDACHSDNSFTRDLVSSNGFLVGSTSYSLPTAHRIARHWGQRTSILVGVEYGGAQHTNRFVVPDDIAY